VAEASRLQRFANAGPLTWLLAACASWGVLLWGAALAGMGGDVAPAPVTAGAPLPTPKPAAPDRIGPLAQYAEAASRPLFTEDRRPRTFMATGPDSGNGAAQAQSLDFILTGVLISPQVRLAILQPASGGDSQRVREGHAPDGAAGWRLVEVQRRHAVFEGPDGQRRLDMRTFGVAGAPAQSATGGEPVQQGQQVQDDGGQASEAARAAAAAAAAASVQEPGGESARIEEIRRRIEARRAQLQAAGQDASPPPAPPGT
jgi:general secretion pathway protein N